MEIEEKYEKARRATQFEKWSNKANALGGLPVLDNKRKGWHIPTNNINKKSRHDLEDHDVVKSQKDERTLSKTEMRRLKEIKKKEEAKLKKNKQMSKAMDGDNHCSSEIKILIKSPKDVARICDLVMSDPEKNIELLTILLEYCEKNWNSSAKKMQGSNLNANTANFPVELSIISLVLVVKDLVPGYKISNQILGLEEGSEAANDKVSLRKETQKIHSFERKILNIYKRTCLLLKKILGFGSKSSTIITRNKAAVLRSSMDLLDASYHFNNHTILLRMIILFLMSGNDMDTQTKSCLTYCSEILTNILTNDTTLETGVESVNIIHDVLFNRKSKKNAVNMFTLSKWILLPFTKYAPYHRIEESRSEFRRIFGSNTSTISKEIIDEIQQTSATRVKVELLVEREEQILKHLFTFYSKVLLLDLDELEHVYQGISQYSNRISSKVRSELIEIIRNKLYNNDTLRWQNFVMVLKCCFTLLQKGNQLNEQQLEDNSWILRYLVVRLEKESVKLKNILNTSKSVNSDYLSEMDVAFQDKELSTVILNTSIFSSSNSSYLYRLIFAITEISLLLCKSGGNDSSINLIKLCGHLIIKYPKLKVLLDPEGIPCNDFPIDANCVLSTWKYQEISLYFILNEIIENNNSNTKLRLACNMLLSESADNSVRKNALASIKKNFGRKEALNDDVESSKRAIEELKPLYYILKLVNL